ncbi:ATP-binding protein [Kocuria salina]|uniref:AAA family ATPase n=1 Tax=Kocuria salina TaxID=1929416 RepID=UPI0015930F85|nr:AAA family ATPase [Kocuria salina]NVC25607.1 ATP-binding protein [Kocuria salina]
MTETEFPGHENLSVDKLVSLIGHGWCQVDMAEPRLKNRQILVNASTPKGFVYPILKILGEPVAGAQVQLISAPAGVGKSWLAQAIADKTNNPLWDLSRYQVGSNFFTGTMVKHYGRNFSKANEALLEGKGALVIDALDEALVRAGLRNAVEAIEDLTDLIKGVDSSLSSVVLLGRPESIQLAGATLASSGITCQSLEVTFFSKNSRDVYLREKASIYAQESGRQIGSAIMDEFLYFVNNDLAETIGEADDSFLGYAPVLDALALMADQPNLFASLKQMRSSVNSFAWPFLAQTINWILSRETEKFANSFGQSDPLKREAAREVYSSEFQLRALLLHDLDDIDVYTHAYDAQSWRPSLRPALQAQVREHPFLAGSGRGIQPWADVLTRLRNSVFRDYLAAWAFCHGVPESRQVGLSYSRPEVPPSPVLMRMVMEIAGAEDILDGEIIGPFLDSLAASEGFGSGYPVAHLSQTEDPSVIELRFSEGFEREWQSQVLLPDAGKIWVARWVKDCNIDVPEHSVGTGAGRSDFALGGTVSINCKRIESYAASVRVMGESKVTIVTTEISGVTEEITVHPSSMLSIVCPSAGFPWVRYRVQDDPADKHSEAALVRAAIELRGILQWHPWPIMMRGPGYENGRMDALIARKKLNVPMVRYLSEQGLISRRDRHYSIEFPAGTPTIRDCDVQDPTLRKFILGYLDWKSQKGLN